MKRFAEEKSIMQRRAKFALQSIGAEFIWHELGRMRKKHPLDCGKARCGVCAAYKRFGHKETRQEAKSRLAWKMPPNDP